jgi:hypothetical protein
MKKQLIKVLLLNILIGIILFVVLFFSAYTLGSGSSVSHLPQEKRLFIGFAIFHFIINFLLLYRYKQFNWIITSTSILLIVIFYLGEAWKFGYFI